MKTSDSLIKESSRRNIPHVREPAPLSLQRMVVVHQGALGDFLLGLPIFDGLHYLFPAVTIDFWSKPAHAALMSTKPYFGEVRSCEGSELVPFFQDTLWKEARIPEFFMGAQSVYIFGQKSSRLLAERLGARMEFPVYWIQSFPDSGHLQPVSRFLADQLRQLGFSLPDTVPHLEPLPEEKSAVHEWFDQQGWGEEKPVIVHPGSGGIRKVWPLARWWALLRWLRLECRLPVVMTLGPADEALKAFAGETSSLGVRLLEEVPLTRLLAVLAASRFYMGSDSGVTHLAATTGIPVIALFGPTLPEVWAPQGPHIHVIKGGWKEKEILMWSKPSSSMPVEPSVKKVVENLI